jgi:hypothetical protein
MYACVLIPTMIWDCNFFSLILLLITVTFVYFTRQRYQHKLKSLGHHCTLSDEREQILTNAGFIWDSHAASWQEQFQLLEQFALQRGHCNVPTKFQGSATLNVWCKQQRKQHKLFLSGQPSTLTEERYRCLDSISFNWNPRGV